MFDVWLAGRYLRMFCIHLYVVCIRSVRNKSFLNQFVPNSQTIMYVGLFIIIIPNLCVRRADVLNDSRISFLCQFGSLRICFVRFLLVFYFQSTFGIVYAIYILVGFNHLYMVINCPLKGLGWSFPDTAHCQSYHVNIYHINIIKPST